MVVSKTIYLMDFDDDNYSTDSSEARERGKNMGRFFTAILCSVFSGFFVNFRCKKSNCGSCRRRRNSSSS